MKMNPRISEGKQYLNLLLAFTISLSSPALFADSEDDLDVLDLQLEDLLNISVTSASKKKESLSDVASAVFVISNNDIKRSGVTNLPDALRMVPGIQVSRIDSNKWAVTSRGFNGRFANKLLVMVDGRTVYSPTYSGVYWEMEDVLLEDVERIEVIRGPGGSVWGANAVNGVINIISKHSADTQSTFLSVGAGSYEKAFVSARTGGKIGDGGYGRVYLKANQRDEFVRTNGENANDAWENFRLGGRADYRMSAADSVTVLGEYFQGNIDQDVVYATLQPPYQWVDRGEVDFDGYNMSIRWDHSINDQSDWSLQFYYDHKKRDEFILGDERDTYDLDFTHRLALNEYHDVVWGLSYRYMREDLTATPVMDVNTESQSDELYSVFIQDEISLIADQLTVTPGAKLERNDYTGDEFQPSLKLNWKNSESSQIWMSIAKAVRTPSIAELYFDVNAAVYPPFTSVNLSPYPLFGRSSGTPDLQSEELYSYELGMRFNPSSSLSLDVVLFYNDYKKLRSFEQLDPQFVFAPEPYLTADTTFNNKVTGHITGSEVALAWMASDSLTFDLAYAYADTHIGWKNVFDVNQNTPNPRHQLSLRSGYNFSKNIHGDVWLRYTGKNEIIASYQPLEIDSFVTMDLRLAWKLSEMVEVSLVGQNLLDSKHPEYVQELFIQPTEVERSAYAKIDFLF